MHYRIEKYADCSHDVVSLLDGHWHETESFPDKWPVALCHDRFEAVERNGMLVCVTARGDEVAMQGVAVWMVYPDPKHGNDLVATSVFFFVAPDARGAMIGSNLISRSEQLFRRNGVKVMAICVRNRDEFMPLVRRHGFQDPETTWLKWIGD